MAEYNNHEGWEASKKTLDYWRFIPMKASKNQHFEMPPLFKSVNPIIHLLIFGFFGIFILEGYATFGVAMTEGVPFEVITLLVFVDIFLAILPHLNDGKITDLRNFIFIGKYKKYLNFDSDEETLYSANYINNTGKLKAFKLLRIILFIPIIISTFAKLYLFFSQYPFYDTYPAYIVLVCYILGGLFHILCTGYVIMFWRFRLKLNSNRKQFGKTKKKNIRKDNRPDKLINVPDNNDFNPYDNTGDLQRIIKKENSFYINYKGILFDEEINNFIDNQDSIKQQFAVALTAKIIQTNLLSGTEKI